MKEYAICDQDFAQLATAEEHYDRIAPSTQDIEHQDEMKGKTDLTPELNESYNLSDDLGIPSTNLSNDDDEYRYLVQKLNAEQKEFYQVLHKMKTTDEPIYCFLSGGDGVRKSHLTKVLYRAALNITIQELELTLGKYQYYY